MSDPLHPSPVSIFGLGIIGARAADHVRAAGYEVTTWNRTPRDRTDYQADAATAADSAGILAFYLKDAPAVREVFAAISSKLGPGKTLINHATIDLDTTTWLENECHELGCRFLNAPFTGSKVAAANGKLCYYAGCSEDDLAGLAPYLEATSSNIIATGSASHATVIKLTTNLISASTVQALAESLRINQSFGVSPELFLKAVNTNACDSVLAHMKIPSMAKGDFDPHFSLANMLKDARYAMDLASRSGLETPGIATTAGQMQKLTDAGLGDLDFSSLFQQFPSHDS